MLDLRPPAPEMAETTEAKLDQILGAIPASKQELSTKVDAVAIALGLLQPDQQKLAARVTHTEHDITELNPEVKGLVEQVDS
ncbi:hypothetical protein NDU88_000922 [Pleurodeles waltl]|uniref:Uncharacterized protein n=1 Tax=Pleurodeles waltl TaxID=8319 RepID=A0AAV7TH94_PLEWA|nr:hypothetical protein NDU88_000922 [Pleurodeles waltl]